MSQLQFSGLLVVWLLQSTLFIATLTGFEFRRVRFNFNVFFSLLFLPDLLLRFPWPVFVFRFDVSVAPPEILLEASCQPASMRCTASPIKRLRAVKAKCAASSAVHHGQVEPI